LTEVAPASAKVKALNSDGYDDGGVADLFLVLDLDELVLRRKRGNDMAFFSEMIKTDLLPRQTVGPQSHKSRRDQKMHLAQVLFSDDNTAGVTKGSYYPTDDNSMNCEIYVDHDYVNSKENDNDLEAKQHRYQRLQSAKDCLKLSLQLKEASCVSMALSEISKRYLNAYGKTYAPQALRCSEKAIEIVLNDYWDTDEMEMEVSGMIDGARDRLDHRAHVSPCPYPWFCLLDNGGSKAGSQTRKERDAAGVE
jgi:hypothetical protein